MRTTMRGILCTLCAVAALLAAEGRARAAVEFTVSDVKLTDLLNGADWGFEYSLQAQPPGTLPGIEVGQSATFTYGTFSTSAFPIDILEGLDFDLFTVAMKISPPMPAADIWQIGAADAVRIRGEAGQVRFSVSNDPIFVDFDGGGKYAVSFLTPSTMTANGTVNLQASITLLSAPLLSAPVPEANSLVVWSLLGLTCGVGVIRSRYKRSKR
jgi:hypothetical protein